MTTIEMERNISSAFSGGELTVRELRLTTEEANYIRTHYPAAVCPISDLVGEKAWYQISLSPITA